jgi:hypothetical protein
MAHSEQGKPLETGRGDDGFQVFVDAAAIPMTASQ